MNDSKRLIEDYLPIEAISAEASREKSVRKGHISTLHLWWARRPLVACRAAVYGALVPASQFVPNSGSDEKKKSLGRANAAKFVTGLCQYPGSAHFIGEAQQHVLSAHAGRLTRELVDWRTGQAGEPGWMREFKFSGKAVSVDDIKEGRVPRPRVLDMFAGGGAIPLEALRLGCEAYALDLNPVAHVIELCTLVYPQKYGKPDPTKPGMTGTKGKDGKATWGGLADEVRYWGEIVLKRVKAEIGDLYPLIPDPAHKGKRQQIQTDWLRDHAIDDVPPGYLMPIAYLWTRSVICKNPSCRAIVPLVKQTWLCRKPGRYVALKMVAPKGQKQVRFVVVESRTEDGLGFDPTAFSKGGNAICPFCSTVADDDYVKSEAMSGKSSEQLLAVVASRPGKKGKVYLEAGKIEVVDNRQAISERLGTLHERSGIEELNEPIVNDGKASFWCVLYGVTTWGRVFSDRQRLALLSFCRAIAEVSDVLRQHKSEAANATSVYLGLMASRMANFSSTLCLWNSTGGRGVVHSFSHQAVPFTWDYPESNPFYPEAAGWMASMEAASSVLQILPSGVPAHVIRGDARQPVSKEILFDAVITDPPYYDNISYADLADFFYVWLKRSIGKCLPEHFAGAGSPKKSEVVSDRARHAGNETAAKQWFEENLGRAFEAGYSVLKPGGILACVYAHKTTLGWATLVDALRRAGFMVSEAWPLSTERPGGMKVDKAMLASSIFLIARKRDGSVTGNYEETVRPELEQIVRERVATLWGMRVSGADLVIACVGAGLRAFTRFAQVEYANGDAVPAERFLAEVEGVVLDAILARLSKEVGVRGDQTSLAGMDAPTRFYILWRYTYGATPLEAGEAIVFANGTHVELDGAEGLSAGANAIVEKKKGKYRLREFAERGEGDDLGLPDENGNSSSVIDVLHRLLWLQKRRPRLIPEFLAGARVGMEQLRLVAQSLAGPALKGGEMKDVSPTEEQAELGKLLANWQTITAGGGAVERRTGQQKLL